MYASKSYKSVSHLFTGSCSLQICLFVIMFRASLFMLSFMFAAFRVFLLQLHVFGPLIYQFPQPHTHTSLPPNSHITLFKHIQELLISK